MSLLPDDSFKQLSNVRKEFDRMFSAFPFDFSFFDNMLDNFGGMTINVHETATEVIATCVKRLEITIELTCAVCLTFLIFF